MENTYRVGVLGLGGVGGYLGGLLARTYTDNPEVEVVFIARGQTKANIETHGLRIASIDEEFTVKPDIVSDDPAQIGNLDLLLVGVKSYSLESALTPYVGNLSAGSTVITLQNSVKQTEIVQPILPADVDHLPGCVYIISNVKEPGYIVRQQSPEKVFFGPVDGNTDKYQEALTVMTNAGIDAQLVNNIDVVNWNKFMFISSVATATSYFNETIMEMLNNPEHRDFLLKLVSEVKAVAMAQGLEIDQEIADKVITVTSKLGPEAKSSMQLDIEKGLQSEIEDLTHSVIQLGQNHGTNVEAYTEAYQGILARIR